MAKKTNSELFTSLLYIIVGVLLAVFPGKALGWAMTIIGVVFVVSGVLDLIKGNMMGGLISLVIGIAVLVLGWTLTGIVLLVLGILIAVKGVVALLDALKKSNKGLMALLFPILTIVIGVLLAFGNALEIMVIIGGILLAANGVVGLLGSLKK